MKENQGLSEDQLEREIKPINFLGRKRDFVDDIIKRNYILDLFK